MISETAALALLPTAVRFTGGDGGSTTLVTAKEPTTLTCGPLTPEVFKSELKSLANATGSNAETAAVRPVACDPLAASTAKGTASVDVAKIERWRRPLAALNTRPDVLTLTELGGSRRYSVAITRMKEVACAPLKSATDVKPPRETDA